MCVLCVCVGGLLKKKSAAKEESAVVHRAVDCETRLTVAKWLRVFIKWGPLSALVSLFEFEDKKARSGGSHFYN